MNSIKSTQEKLHTNDPTFRWSEDLLPYVRGLAEITHNQFYDAGRGGLILTPETGSILKKSLVINPNSINNSRRYILCYHLLLKLMKKMYPEYNGAMVPCVYHEGVRFYQLFWFSLQHAAPYCVIAYTTSPGIYDCYTNKRAVHADLDGIKDEIPYSWDYIYIPEELK